MLKHIAKMATTQTNCICRSHRIKYKISHELLKVEWIYSARAIEQNHMPIKPMGSGRENTRGAQGCSTVFVFMITTCRLNSLYDYLCCTVQQNRTE